MTISFWFRLKNSGGEKQTLFILQDTSSADWDFALEYITSLNAIRVAQQNPAFSDTTADLLITQRKKNFLNLDNSDYYKYLPRDLESCDLQFILPATKFCKLVLLQLILEWR